MKHVPWTLSSDGKGRITVVLGTSYGTSMTMNTATSVEDRGPMPGTHAEAHSERIDLVAFLKALVEHDGDLVALAASGNLGQALFREAFDLLGEHHDAVIHGRTHQGE